MGLKSVPTRSRMRSAFAFLLGAIGLGLCAWYGQDWLALPHYSQTDIDRSAQLNWVIDLQRLPLNLRPSTTDQHADMLRKERQEVVDDIGQERKKTQAGFAAGLILLVLSAGQALFICLTRRKHDN